MRKLFALLMVACMLLGLMACSGTPAATDKPADSATDTPATDTPATDTPATDAPAADTNEPAKKVENKIIYGSTTELGGDFSYGLWTNGATDRMVCDLMNDYATVTTDQGGQYLLNNTVVKDMATTENADGSKTFTITINDGLVFSNGDPITAKNFVAYSLFICSPMAVPLEVNSSAYMDYVGSKEFHDGEADTFAGLRLVDEMTYSITVNADSLPYFYEISYVTAYPWHIGYWFGEGADIADDGNGCYFTMNGSAEAFTADAIKDSVQAARNPVDSTAVSAGPYILQNYDKSAKQATLVINDTYAGNFEGQKPSIETIVVTKAEEETWADAITTGEFNFYDTITNGTDINTALDIIENKGGFDYVRFDRAGYGMIEFMCDFGPTQFQEVRQAVAYLLDRNAFADTFCAGWGTVVSGPYGTGMWQYKDSEEFLADNLNTYSYSPDMANQVLTEGGWVYTADGSEWTPGSGLRYKEVTEEQAVNYEDYCVTADGKLLMPLQIQWTSSEGNAVSDLIATMLAKGSDVANAGMQINQATMDFSTLLCYLYRQDSSGTGGDYTTPTYGMFNLATTWRNAAYNSSYAWTGDPDMVAQGYNGHYLYDLGEGGLDQLSMDMVYGVDPEDAATYLDLWQKYIVRWNELLPDLPLYSNVYVTMYPDYLEGYEQASYWSFRQAILYASIPTAE